MSWRLALMPLGWIYGSVAAARRALYEHILHAYEPPVPTIGVGNLSVGGTGKTPHTAMIADILSKNFQTALLSRGYGRKTKGFILANDCEPNQLSAETIGDEPLLLHQRFPKMPLAVDGNRERGIKELIKRHPDLEAFVLDDVLQHVSIKPSCRILLTEYHHPYFQDYPLPAGNLREFRSAARIADVVMVTKADVPQGTIDKKLWRKQLGLNEKQQLFFTKYLYSEPKPVTTAAQEIDLGSNTPIVLLTGIAHPEPLVQHLQKKFTNIRHLSFRDHHAFTQSEIEDIKNWHFGENHPKAVLFTTEKDWMRLQSKTLKNLVSLLPVFSLPIEVGFVFDNDRELFINIIESHVTRNKSKS